MKNKYLDARTNKHIAAAAEREAREGRVNYSDFSNIAYSTARVADAWDDGALDYYSGACKRFTGCRL